MSIFYFTVVSLELIFAGGDPTNYIFENFNSRRYQIFV